MKAVVMSIQPKWCELIASGKKTVEVRKTKPKLAVPFKVYIYETQGRTETPFVDEEGHHIFKGRGKVIGEFVCDNIGEVGWYLTPDHPMWEDRYDEETCLTDRETYEYSKGGTFYHWLISNLIIYDTPRELGEFRKPSLPTGLCYEDDAITRPPQSWCYVEEESDG